MRVECQKLVRDHITALLDEEKTAYESSILAEDTFKAALYKKLLEEAAEVISAPPDERLQELADVHEVLDAITRLSGFTLEQVCTMQQKRRKTSGGFEKRIMLHWFEKQA